MVQAQHLDDGDAVDETATGPNFVRQYRLIADQEDGASAGLSIPAGNDWVEEFRLYG